MKRLYGTIDLTAIGRIVRNHPELVQEVMFKDGAHKMLRIDVHAKKEVDQYGNVAFIKATCKKEEQREGVNYYISNLKESKYQDEPQQPQQTNMYAQQQQEVQTEGSADDLPFDYWGAVA